PADLAVPVVIVQHMPSGFTRSLADRLDRTVAIRVGEGVDGAVLHGAQVWIAPGNHHMLVRAEGSRVRLRLTREPPENSCRPAIDVLFRSTVDAYHRHVLGVVLTGMGKDGLLGCEAIRRAGGQVLAQDAASCVVWGIPRAVTEAG